ncbi:MAG: FAD-linked oxidase [Thermomicrobiales bacterium]|nr:FAD-linked oxidase [Thermomicrobiales bacterium]
MGHAPAHSDALEAAGREWQALLGADGVLRAPHVLGRYGRTTLPDASIPVAVLRPQGVEQVVPVVRVAAAHRVPLYPISRGKNWGWGDACPVTAGQVILDLSALDRIIAVDEELGYAVVQPGVTQGQLAEHLRATGSAWWLDATAAGPDTSVLGNILERGGTRDERSTRVSGMEVVLADGTVVRTGYGHYPGSRVTHVARWGIGPSLDGLFSQSNLGVVTALGFWLQPRPAHAELGYYAVPDEALEAAIDALRPFRIRGVIPGQPLQLTPTGDQPVWLGITTLQGHPQVVAAHREELTAALAPVARVAFPRPEEAADPDARAATLAKLGLPANPFFDNILRRTDPLAAPRMAPEGLLAWLGGPGVQHPTEPPTATDPLDHDYGFYFAWPTCPALGREVRALLDIVRPILAVHNCPQLMALRFVTGREIVLVMRIAFDRKREERRAAARACHHAIVDATLAAGYPPARMAIDGMDRLDPAADSYWQVVRRLKRCLDPDGILAPGRYLPPAAGG